MIHRHAEDNMDAFEYLRQRDELLQVMYWMLGEGLGAQPSIAQVESFLGSDPVAIGGVLRRMTAEGYVKEVGHGGYELTPLGLSEGKRSFADEFAGLTNQAHGECSPDCTFCHSPDGDPAQCPSKAISHAAAG